MRVRLTGKARADLQAQIDWLVDRTPQAARRAAQRIRIQLALIGEFPQAAPEVGGGLRDATVRFGRDGFVVVTASKPARSSSSAYSTGGRAADAPQRQA